MSFRIPRYMYYFQISLRNNASIVPPPFAKKAFMPTYINLSKHLRTKTRHTQQTLKKQYNIYTLKTTIDFETFYFIESNYNHGTASFVFFPKSPKLFAETHTDRATETALTRQTTQFNSHNSCNSVQLT